MENVSASNCQYVQILDLHQRPGSSQPTYISQSGQHLLASALHLNPNGSSGQMASQLGTHQLSMASGLSPAALARDGIIEFHPHDAAPTRGKGKGRGRGGGGNAGVKQSPYYPRASAAHFMHHVGLSPAHPTPMRAGPSRMGPTTGRKRVADRLIRPESEYAVFIPKKSMTCKEFNAKIDCKGCGIEFPATFVSGSAIFGSPEFFVHCIKECAKYRDLQLIRKCDECALLFLNTQSERKHHGEAHQKKMRIKKPDWMSDQVYRVRSGIRCNTKVSCSACGLYFGAQNSAGKISYSLEYL